MNIILPFSQLHDDYTKFSFLGFYGSMDVVPMVFASKEDAIDQDIFNIDFEDPEATDKMMTELRKRQAQVFGRTPMIKTMVAGNFRELLEKGFFEDGKVEE